ncbi:MAG: hydrogenase large subunit, partial [Actinomycetota bacterium]|nr:hydrogenase large subunit [Actinomycetota bacterium]
QNTTEHFAGVKKRVTDFLGSGQLGMFAGGYAGHPAHQLTPHGDLLFMDHYLQALAWQRDAVQIHAALGGKNPHPQTYLVGGMSTPLDPSSTAAVTPAALSELRALSRRMRTFVEQVYLPDVLYLARQYPEWTSIGRGVGSFLSYGDFPGADGTPLVPAGVLRPGSTTVEDLDEQRITEDVSRAWYERAEPARPGTATTVPAYTGPTPPWTDLDTDGAYSWGKAPRYGGQVMEVGPLARLEIARVLGVPRVVELLDGALPSLGGKPAALVSTLGRMTARALETLWFVEQLDGWLAELSDNITSGDLRIVDPAGLDRTSWPARATGYGLTEAPRGALGHWVRIADGKMTGYQIVIPSTWNGSPRDAQGERGAWEQALLGVPVADGDRPLEVLRLLHSFDPCMACAVHVLDPSGNTLADITVVP